MMGGVKIAFAASTLLLIAAIGCKGGDSTPPAPAATSFAAAQAVLATRCQSCHGGATPAAGINLTTYEGIQSAITPGDPANSTLIKAMRGAPGVKKMPPNGAPATEAEIKTVETWIQSGAKQA